VAFAATEHRTIPPLEVVRAQLAESMAASRPSGPPRPAESPPVEPRPVESRPAESSDPLGGLPRLSRFDYDWDEPSDRRPPSLVWDFDHVEPPSRSSHRPAAPEYPAVAPPPAPPVRPAAPAPYVGRRRSAGDSAPGFDAPAGGPTWNEPNGLARDGAKYHGADYHAAEFNGAEFNGAGPNGAAGHAPGLYGGPNGTANGSIGSNGAANGSVGSNGAANGSVGSNGASHAAAPHALPTNGANGAHLNGSGSVPNATIGEVGRPVGGRRRRAEGEVDDVLARLLGR
jgi:hypothetical protein